MHTHPFSDSQAAHALAAVLSLIKDRRFFLYQQESGSSGYDLGHGLQAEVFGQALKLNADIRATYAEATRQAKETIEQGEEQLGIKPAILCQGQRLVQCNRFSGGLEICRVYPLTAFLEFVPTSLEEMRKQEVRRLMGDKTQDDYSGKEMQKIEATAAATAAAFWQQFAALKAKSKDACVVLLKTRFRPSGGYGDGDFMEGKTADVELFPHAMGYLFYEYSRRTRIVRHAYAVFSTSRHGHVRVEHRSDKEPEIDFNVELGYSCTVYFPIVL
ncbi:hypothetical protein EXS57_02460 [Candidatus Kaiserbacteria bacterium]|nr:hypothetical protein [Candidatus Kaiserbacteria bacterium]